MDLHGLLERVFWNVKNRNVREIICYKEESVWRMGIQWVDSVGSIYIIAGRIGQLQ